MTNQTDNFTNYPFNMNNTLYKMSTLVAVEQYMSIYGPFILTTFGIIGNILSILIFLSPRYRRQSSHFYLLSLALSDLCFLIINLIEDTFRNHNALYQSRINILDRSSTLICILVQYARNTTRLLSSWIIVSFTIERLLVVFYPLKRAVICRRKIARFVVLILFLLSLLININVPFHYAIIVKDSNIVDNEDTICDIVKTYRRTYMKFAIATMIIVYLVPMCLISIVNTLICCKLWRRNFLTEKDQMKTKIKQKENLTSSRRLVSFSDFLSCLHSSSNSRKQIERLNKSRTSSLSQYQSVGPLITTETNITMINGSHLVNDHLSFSRRISNSNSSINSPIYTKQSSSNVKTYIQSQTNRVTVTLLLVSCSFLLLNSPYCIIWIINYIHRFLNTKLQSIKEITELFMLTNFCINILLYCVSGKIFRTELMYLIRCQSKELYSRHENERMSKKRTRPKIQIQLQESKGKFQPSNIQKEI